MAKPLEYNATLVDRIDLTSALAIFKVRPDDAVTADPAFLPGQYMTLGMNNKNTPELGSVRRPMSIASAPEEAEVFEFYVRYVNHPESDNPLTHLLWSTKAGERLHLRSKAVGKFTVPDTVGDNDSRIRVCVAAGTGLAPFLSMVRNQQSLDPETDLSRWVILHGASYPDDLGYREELESMVAQGLHYYSTVSRPQEAPDWKGDTGRVEDYFLAERLAELEERLGLGAGEFTPKHTVVFICGLQGTISQTIVRLNSRGFVPENRKLRRAFGLGEEVPSTLFFEQYDSTPVIDIKNPEVMDPLRQELHDAIKKL
jgi:ferredoxin--NADP+ reductase